MGAPASGGLIMNVNTTDIRTGRRIMAAVDPITGGSGGRKATDGAYGSGANQGLLKNTPVEVNEVEAGIKVLRYGLARDSAGPGLNRGGLGTELVFQAQSPNTRVTARNRDRTVFTGWGIAGGRAGAPSRFVRTPAGPGELDLPQHRYRPRRSRRRDPRLLRRRRRLGRPAGGAPRHPPRLGLARARPQRLRRRDR